MDAKALLQGRAGFCCSGRHITPSASCHAHPTAPLCTCTHGRQRLGSCFGCCSLTGGKGEGGLEPGGEIPAQAQTGNTSTNTTPTTPSCSDHPRALRIRLSLDPVECGCDPGVSPHGTRQLKCKNLSAKIENFLRPSWFCTVFPPNCKTRGIFWWFCSEVSQFAPVTQIHRDHGILSMACQILAIFPIFVSSQTHLHSNY